MSLRHTIRIAFAWAWLMLPLQGFAAPPACEARVGASQALPHHCAGESMPTQHHNCGDCCAGAAIAVSPVQWIAPLLTPVKSSIAALGSVPLGLPERLDRPPRFAPA
jgi:hypothetical protein